MQKNLLLTILGLGIIVGLGFLVWNKNKQISEPVIVKPAGECYLGGCSGQICSDRQDVYSTCEFKPEYICYQNAVCERQKTGDCGWTQTETLKACLLKS